MQKEAQMAEKAERAREGKEKFKEWCLKKGFTEYHKETPVNAKRGRDE